MNFILKSIFIIFFSYLTFQANSAWADSISKEIIFSEKVFVGAASCQAVTGDQYCNNAIAVYNSDGSLKSNSEKILGACIVGGADCTVVSFALETKDILDGYILARVQTLSNKEAWIKYKKSMLKTVDEWIPKLNSGPNYIYFRPNFNEIYLDKNLTKKIKLEHIHDIPKSLQTEGDEGSIEYVELSTFYTNNKKIIELQINLLQLDPKLNEKDTYEALQKAKRVFLRKIYFPSRDDKNRINYWFQPGSC